MEKTIKTLIKDIHDVLDRRDGSFADHLSENIVREIGPRINATFAETQNRASLRLSAMGEKCPRSLWASVHSPSSQEAIPSHAKVKFTYGHLVEGLLVGLAKSAGHEVTGEGDEVYAYDVKGHRDCVIDGCVVDVKSISSLGFQKVKAGKVPEDIFLRDYLDQLDGYLVGSAHDDLVRIKDKAYLWFCDKTLGHMHLYEHHFRPERIKQRIEEAKRIVALDTPPPCKCGVIADGKSGNLKLDLKASYNPYKYFCFPGLRTFLYASGPVHLVKVVRQPDVPEVNREGVVH